MNRIKREKLPLAAALLGAISTGDDSKCEAVANRLATACIDVDDILRLSREFAAMGMRLQQHVLELKDKEQK